MKKEYKLFFDYDHWDGFGDRKMDWLCCGWRIGKQIGFRFFGVYLNLVWRNKANAEPS